MTEAEFEELDREWREAGGSMHGPNVETVTMPLVAWIAMRRQLVGGWRPISEAPTVGREMILLLVPPSRFPQVAYSNTWWQTGCSVENRPTHFLRLEPIPSRPAGVL